MTMAAEQAPGTAGAAETAEARLKETPGRERGPAAMEVWPDAAVPQAAGQVARAEIAGRLAA
jgi:hypothetical protein